jgi:hypothetical protein
MNQIKIGDFNHEKIHSQEKQRRHHRLRSIVGWLGDSPRELPGREQSSGDIPIAERR